MTVQMDDYIATRSEVRAYLDKALQDANDTSVENWSYTMM